MSSNKNVYFTVTTVASVKARNKTEALKALRSTRRVPGATVLAEATTVDRVPAIEARLIAEALS